MECSCDKIVLDESEAAKYVHLAVSTLRRGRMEGNRDKRCPTPPYIRIGRAIRYLKSDLDQFLLGLRVGDRPSNTK